MGDRTWVCITVALKDEATLLEVMRFKPEEKEHLNPEERDGLLTVTFDEINWGGYDELRQLAKRKISFMAHNGSGSSYGEGLSVGYRGKLVEVECLEAEPACIIGPNLKPNAVALKNIKRYYSLVKKVEAEFERVKQKSDKQKEADEQATI